MIFFDIDDTLLDFKGAEWSAVAAVYAQLDKRPTCKEREFYKAWCTIGRKQFDRFLRGELTFQQQKIERVMELCSQLEIDMDIGTAPAFFRSI